MPFGGYKPFYGFQFDCKTFDLTSYGPAGTLLFLFLGFFDLLTDCKISSQHLHLDYLKTVIKQQQ